MINTWSIIAPPRLAASVIIGSYAGFLSQFFVEFVLKKISHMPIYEYRCESCGHQFEALQKMSDAPLTECRACGALALKKLVSAAAFKLKGSGWYETDFKNSGKPASKGSADSTTSGSASDSADNSAAGKTSSTDSKSGAASA